MTLKLSLEYHLKTKGMKTILLELSRNHDEKHITR